MCCLSKCLILHRSSEGPQRVGSPAERLCGLVWESLLMRSFISRVRTWFMRSSRGKTHPLRLLTCLWNSDMSGNIVGINQNQLATWLERDGEEANGEDFEYSALNKVPWLPGVWTRMNEIGFGLFWHPVPGVNGDCCRKQGILFFLFNRRLCGAWFRISQPCHSCPLERMAVNTVCWVNFEKVVLFLAKCWFKIRFFPPYFRLRINSKS